MADTQNEAASGGSNHGQNLMPGGVLWIPIGEELEKKYRDTFSTYGEIEKMGFIIQFNSLDGAREALNDEHNWEAKIKNLQIIEPVQSPGMLPKPPSTWSLFGSSFGSSIFQPLRLYRNSAHSSSSDSGDSVDDITLQLAELREEAEQHATTGDELKLQLADLREKAEQQLADLREKAEQNARTGEKISKDIASLVEKQNKKTSQKNHGYISEN